MTDTPPGPADGVPERPAILLHAPIEEDAAAIGKALSGLDAPVLPLDQAGIVQRLVQVPCPVLCLVLSHEGAGNDIAEALETMHAREPVWSAPPVILLRDPAAAPPPVVERLAAAQSPLPLLLLDRPSRPEVLASAASVQIRARRRQFEAARLMADLAEAEKRQRFLLNELRHRSRNVLAVVMSLFSLSLRRATDLGQLEQDFGARLSAAVRAQSDLSDEADTILSLRHILETHVAPYALHPDQLQIEGPEVMLTSRASFDLAIVIHELATNAAKYGALSERGGRVGITAEPEEDSLRIAWVESGGPPVSPPERSGLGSAMIRARSLAQGDGARIAFPPEGFSWSLTLRPGTIARIGDEGA